MILKGHKMRKVGGPQRLWRACGVVSTFSIGHGGVAFEAGSDTAQLCFYLSMEHLRSGRLRERGPAGRLTVAKQNVIMVWDRHVAVGLGKGSRKKRGIACVSTVLNALSQQRSLSHPHPSTHHVYP